MVKNIRFSRCEKSRSGEGGLKMIEVNWESSFDLSGYGRWGRGCVEALLSSPEYNMKVSPIGYRLKHDDPLYKYQNVEQKNPIRVINNIPLHKPIGKRVGFCTCTEISNPPHEQVRNMNKSDFVIALSSYCQGIYKGVLNDPEKVFKVNFPIFRGEMTPIGPRIEWKTIDNKFKFLFVGRIDARKNIETLISAFAEEFGNNKNVVLILKIYSPDFNIPLWIKAHNPSENVLWFRERIKDMSLLYRSVNAYVTSDLGEAWSGPTQEAMLCGLPTIAPRHSGHLDYMNDENSYLVKVSDWKTIGYRKDNIYDRLLPAEGLVKYPDFEDLKAKMRLVYETYKFKLRKEVLENELIKNALKTQEMVDRHSIFEQLDKCFKWVDKNVK